MKHALILSESLAGHRQVYCQVLTETCLREDMRVTIAGGLSSGSPSRSYPYVEYYRSNPRVTLLDLGDQPVGAALSPAELAGLVARCAPDVIVLPEADSHLLALTSHALPLRKRWDVRVVGIFIRSTNYIHGRSRVPATRGRPRYLPRMSLSDPVLFHEFVVPHLRPVDTAFCLDEYFVEGHPATHVWLPDMYKATGSAASDSRTPDGERWIGRLDEFCRRNDGRFRLLYFGTAQGRRGYQALLRLASDENACFVHCGLRSDREERDAEVTSLRASLEREGRLLETNRFEDDPAVVERFFQCADRMVLPYTGFRGSSGVMLQALEYGQPVLVHSQGLMGRRVNEHNLGMTLSESSYEELRSAFRVFCSLRASDFKDPIERFMQRFREGQAEQTLARAIRGGQPGLQSR